MVENPAAAAAAFNSSTENPPAVPSGLTIENGG
jgi:hypothetical protein